MTCTLSASLVSADLGRLADELKRLEEAGIPRVHFDVEDGTFVPNFTFGFPMLRAVRRLTTLPIDVHLMVANPEPYLESFAALADTLAVHWEACPYPRRVLQRIRSLGRKAWLALNPRTPPLVLAPYRDLLDGVLLLSTEPDLAGEAFMPVTYERLEEARRLLGPEIAIGVDGGVGPAEAARLRAGGVSLLVVGRSLFGAHDIRAAAADLGGVLRLSDLIRPEYIRILDSASDDKEAVSVLADALLACDVVQPDFGARVLEREREFPTGLPTPGVKVALPHTEAQWVKESAVAVGVLRQPVTFRVMGEPSETVDVQVIFLLAIRQQDKQAEMLSQVVQLVQDQAFLQTLVAQPSTDRVHRLVQQRLGPDRRP